MTQRDDYDDSVKALHRMIAYVRDEAMRLRISDVALLLARAEDAVGCIVPTTATEQDGCWRDGTGESIVEH